MDSSLARLKAEFLHDRREALMDLSKLEAYTLKYRIELPKDPASRLRGILKARTACPDLPIGLRMEAKAQLIALGSASMDAGDLA